MSAEFVFGSFDEEIEKKSEMLEEMKEFGATDDEDDFAERILESIFMKSEAGILSFMKLLVIAMRERPLAIEKYSNLCVLLCNKCELMREIISEKWVTALFRELDFASIEPNLLFFVNQLLHHSIISEEMIIKVVGGMYEDYYNRVPTRDICTCYFGPELSKDPYIWEKYVVPLFSEVSLVQSLGSRDVTWFGDQSLMENDWKLWREARLRLWGVSQILEVLIKDDVARLRTLAASPDFSVDGVLEWNILIPFDYMRWDPPYIGVAAFLRAEKCYQFLVNCHADFNKFDSCDHSPAQFAAASGCVEILRSLEELGASFDGVFQVSAGFSQYSVFEWRGESTDLSETVSKRTNVVSQAAIENNMYLMKLCIENGVDVNTLDNLGRFPLYKAILYGNYEVMRMLLSHETVSLTQRYRDSSLLAPAASTGQATILEFLLDYPGIEFTDTDIMEALECVGAAAQVECVKILQRKRPDVFSEWFPVFVRSLWPAQKWWLFKKEWCSFCWESSTAVDKLALFGFAVNISFDERHPQDIFIRWIFAEHRDELESLVSTPVPVGHADYPAVQGKAMLTKALSSNETTE